MRKRRARSKARFGRGKKREKDFVAQESHLSETRFVQLSLESGRFAESMETWKLFPNQTGWIFDKFYDRTTDD